MDLKNRTGKVLLSPPHQKLETLARTHRILAKQIAAGQRGGAHDVLTAACLPPLPMCIARGRPDIGEETSAATPPSPSNRAATPSSWRTSKG
jgi:hypothetical protein